MSAADEQPPFARPRRKRATGDRGKGWEMWLKELHRRYAAELKAQVEKQHAEAKPVDGRLQFVAKGSPDFGGTLYGSGRSVWFDAKEVSKGDRFPLAGLRSAKGKHQAASLTAHHRAGAIAFLCVRFKEHDRMVVFPWAQVAVALSRGDGSLHMPDGFSFGEEGWISKFGDGRRP